MTSTVLSIDHSPIDRPAVEPQFIARMSSPLGRVEITSDGDAITGLAIEHEGSLPHDDMVDRPTAVLDAAVRQLAEYFAGARREFELPVKLVGTAFQHAVWAHLQSLRFGEVSSYGEIGLATGRPTAGRAVGGAIGANPIPIIVGCHRVLASNGLITGYSAGEGVPTKVWLLDHEGIAHR